MYQWDTWVTFHSLVSVIHRGPSAPKSTVAAVSIIGEEGAAPGHLFDHPLKLPEAAMAVTQHCQRENTEEDRVP